MCQLDLSINPSDVNRIIHSAEVATIRPDGRDLVSFHSFLVGLSHPPRRKTLNPAPSLPISTPRQTARQSVARLFNLGG
jgi:hypothetical protein